jgi:broad specificity phosphatase PhoE
MLPHLLLVQSGPTDLDLQNRFTGRLDLPLSDRLIGDTTRAMSEIEQISVTAVISAPCQASVQTARMLAAQRSLKVKIDKRLVNIDYGLWHGKSRDELKRTQPDVYRRWVQSPERVQAPGGESPQQLQERLVSFLEWCYWKYSTSRVAVVVPAPVARSLAQLYFPADPDEKRFHDPLRADWAWLPIGLNDEEAVPANEVNARRDAGTKLDGSNGAGIDNFSPIWGL